MATSFARGDVVLAPFPFGDLAGHKVRPALVISPGAIGDDVILMAISSVVRGAFVTTDFPLDATHPDFAATGLRVSSVFRAHSLVTIERSLISRRLGRISAAVQAEVDRRLRQALEL